VGMLPRLDGMGVHQRLLQMAVGKEITRGPGRTTSRTIITIS